MCPSLQYCMFENTVLEMQQIVNSMSDAESWNDLDLNEYESRAKETLYDLCQNYIEAYNHFSDVEECEEEDE